MCDRIVEQRQAITTVLSDLNVTEPATEESFALSSQQWNLISSFLPTMKCLQIATTVMCSKTNVSLSSILPIISGLLSQHLILKLDDDDLLKEFKATVSEQLKQRFLKCLHIDDFEIRSCIVDPRHKGLKFVDDIFRKRAYNAFWRSLHLSRLSSANARSASEEPPAKKLKETAIGFLLGDDYFIEESTSDDELEYYLKTPPLAPNEDPLGWWKQNGHKFPGMATLAMKYLCCPGTSTPSERIFSTTGSIVTKKRNALHLENVNN